jgi:hypothetical protein
VVTADGELVRATEDENAELFWGLRGGGGNFGIATEFELRPHPVGPQVVAGPVLWPIQDAARVLRFYREWIADAPDELMTVLLMRKAPALPFVPPDLVGKAVVGVVCCYAGSIEDGERVVRPLKELGSPAVDQCVPKPFVDNQAMFDPSFPHGWWYYVRACDVAEITDDVIDVMIEYTGRIVSPRTGVAVWQMGGAVGRVGEKDTAFNGRDAGHTFNISGITTSAEGFEEEREWARAYWSALSPHHTGVYVNFLMEEGEERVRQAYGASKYERLRALKRTYDPDNVFRLNQNIPPA